MQLPFQKPLHLVGASAGSPSPWGPQEETVAMQLLDLYSYTPHSKESKPYLLKLRILSLISTLRALIANGALAPSQLLCSGPPDTHCAWKLLVCSQALHSDMH